MGLLTMLRLIGVQGTQSSCTTIYWRQCCRYMSITVRCCCCCCYNYYY